MLCWGNFVDFLCDLLFSLCLLCLTQPVLPFFHYLFWKNCFPPSLGSKILQTALSKNHAKNYFSGPPIARITPNLGLVIAPGTCKIDAKSMYNLSMYPLWKLCLPSCVLPHAFWMTISYSRHAVVLILLKNGPWSRNSIAQICKANTACKICRIYMSAWCLLLGVTDFDLHAPLCMRSTACIFYDISKCSPCIRYRMFDKKTRPLSGLTSHKCPKSTLAARSIVFICRHDVVLPESPSLTCMLYFAALKLPCRSKIEGRRCCPPQRAFNNYILADQPIILLLCSSGSALSPSVPPQTNLTLACAWCIFSICESNSRHNGMHYNLQLASWVRHLLFIICPAYPKHLLVSMFTFLEYWSLPSAGNTLMHINP